MQIVVSLIAETGKFVTDINRATKQTERAFKQMANESEKALKDMQREADNAAKAFETKLKIAAVAAATAIALIVKSTINSNEQLGKLSEKVGVAASDLSKLAYAFRLADQDVQVLQTALVRLGESALEAKDPASEAAEAFQAIGVDPSKFNNVRDLFLAVADGVSKYADGLGKTSVVESLFSRQLVDLIPALNQGAEGFRELGEEAERYGLVATDAAVKVSSLFNDSITKSLDVLNGLSQHFVNEGTPLLQTYAEGMVHAAEVISQTLIPVISRLVDLLSGLTFAFIVAKNATDTIVQTFDHLGDATDQLIKGNFKEAIDQLTLIPKDRADNIADVERAYIRLFKTIAEGPKQTGADKPDVDFDPSVQDRADKAAREAEAARKAAVQAAAKLAAELRSINEASARGLAQISSAQNQRETQALQASLDARQISYSQYLQERLRLTEQSIDQEIEIQKGLIETATAAQQVAIHAHLGVLEIERQIARDSAAQDQAKHVREIAAAYDDAAASARSYLAAISREGERNLQDLSATPAERRFNTGQFQIDDRFLAERERLESELTSGGIDKSAYDQQLTLLKNAHADQSAEWDKYYDLLETKQRDFGTQFQNSINQYLEETTRVGETLGNTLVSALDEASKTLSHVAAEFILFGEDGTDAIYKLARSIATQLLETLIDVGIQLLIIKPLLESLKVEQGQSSGQQSTGGGIADLFGTILGAYLGAGKAAGGYTGDLPENEVAGVYHGKEFVVNAQATRQNRDVLEAINNGTFSSDSTSIPRSSSQSLKPSVTARIINVPDKDYIKDYLMGEDGDEVFVNMLGRNSAKVRQAVAG